MFSPSTLTLFKELLDQVSVSAAHPDFDEVVTRVAAARRELVAALSPPTD